MDCWLKTTTKACFSKQQQSCSGGWRQITNFHGISDVSPSGDVRLNFSALVHLGFISWPSQNKQELHVSNQTYFSIKHSQCWHFLVPFYLWQLSQGNFLFLQEAANMLRLIQNRLKEEEQHLLKSGSKWHFLPCSSRGVAKCWLLRVEVSTPRGCGVMIESAGRRRTSGIMRGS